MKTIKKNHFEISCLKSTISSGKKVGKIWIFKPKLNEIKPISNVCFWRENSNPLKFLNFFEFSRLK